MNDLLEFTHPLATQSSLTGGKGCNLARLTAQGFPVPPGFIITAETYRRFLEEAGIEPTRDSSPASIRDRISSTDFPSSFAKRLSRHLDGYPTGSFFSVRSSSTMEDLAEAAFAGQHETFLNLSDHREILQRIRDCYASLWSDHAVAYRTRQGFDPGAASMAVVIQTMIPSDVAGVAFSINPISGDLGEIVINANFGLGESVVDGGSEVDQWQIKKDDQSVRRAHIATKRRRIVAAASGTLDVDITDDEATRPSLSSAQMQHLCRLLVEVEQHYGFPQDIEWAIHGDHLWILQSRPITTIPPRWTREESAESFPNAITPLTWDFVESGFHRSLRHSFRILGLPPYSGKWFANFDHYIYGNQNAVELYARQLPFSVKSLDDLRDALPMLRNSYGWVRELPVSWARDLDHYLLTLGRLRAERLEGRSIPALWQHVCEVNDHGADYFLPNIAISIAHGSLHRLLHGLIHFVLPTDEAEKHFREITAWSETKTQQINRELFDLAALACTDPRLVDLLETQETRTIISESLLNPFDDFLDRFTRFLRDHGHREVDFDAYVPTWIETPWVILDHVKLMLRATGSAHPAARGTGLKAASLQAEASLMQHLPGDLQFFFRELIHLARTYTELDDLEHYQTMRLTPVLRRGLRALGRKLVEKEVLDEPMDVFFSRREQLEEAIRSNSPEGWETLAIAVRKQKAGYREATLREPEWTPDAPSIDVEECSGLLSGLAGSPGVVEGPVFLVNQPEDFTHFPKHAVLVARTTHPAWTPLFYSAIAVITESGGPLSHGAVTAGEMQIPAVMSVRGSMRQLRNGQRVRVDGTTGIVQILDPSRPAE